MEKDGILSSAGKQRGVEINVSRKSGVEEHHLWSGNEEEDTVIIEISQVQKDKHYRLSLMCRS